jgi:uncharacterized repeat protein (TIGR01451 family)/LPXTG-motif cell wall-anchored protein
VTKVGTPVDTNHDGVIDVGDQINWAIQVTNAGASPVSGISISDPTAGTVTCPQTTLTPGQSMTCTPPPHAITSADAAAGGVTNTATAAGSFNGGGITSASSTRVPVAGAAAGAGGSTAFTGLETVKLLLIGLGLVLLGLLLVVLFRRRRSSV